MKSQALAFQLKTITHISDLHATEDQQTAIGKSFNLSLKLIFKEVFLKLTHRKADIYDLKAIISLLADDKLGHTLANNLTKN